MMNLAVGIAESYAQHTPVLALVGQPPLQSEGLGAFQDTSGFANTLDAQKFWSTLSKMCVKITSPLNFWALFQQALSACFGSVHGPAVILLPRDVMSLEVGDVPQGFIHSLPLELTKLSRAPSTSNTIPDKLFSSINRSHSPLIILGERVDIPNAIEELIQLSRQGFHFVTTLAQPNRLQSLENFHGCIGVIGHPQAHGFLHDEADLIISIGSDLNAMSITGLENTLLAKELWVFDVNSTQSIKRFLPAAIESAKANIAIEKIHAGLAPRNLSNTRQKPTTSIKELEATTITYAIKDRSISNTPFGQHQALKVLNSYLPERGQLLLDAGNCAAAAAHYLDIPETLKTTIALGMGGMGYAVAGAIGARLRPSSQEKKFQDSTFVICGDGAFLMTGMEVHTAVDYKIPILWIVFNNNMHGMCVTRQKLLFEGRIEGNTYSEVHISKMVKGFGDVNKVWSACAENAIQLSSLLDEYLSLHYDVPGVLEIKISQEELPPFLPFHQALTA